MCPQERGYDEGWVTRAEDHPLRPGQRITPPSLDRGPPPPKDTGNMGIRSMRSRWRIIKECHSCLFIISSDNLNPQLSNVEFVSPLKFVNTIIEISNKVSSFLILIYCRHPVSGDVSSNESVQRGWACAWGAPEVPENSPGSDAFYYIIHCAMVVLDQLLCLELLRSTVGILSELMKSVTDGKGQDKNKNQRIEMYFMSHSYSCSILPSRHLLHWI